MGIPPSGYPMAGGYSTAAITSMVCAVEHSTGTTVTPTPVTQWPTTPSRRRRNSGQATVGASPPPHTALPPAPVSRRGGLPGGEARRGPPARRGRPPPGGALPYTDRYPASAGDPQLLA